MLDGEDREALDGHGLPPIDTDARFAHQGNAIELPVEVGGENVRRRQMRRGTIVPERDVTDVPLEAYGIFWPRYMLPQQLENLLAFARGHAHDRIQERRADEQHPLPGFRMNGHQRMLAAQRAALNPFVILRSGARAAPRLEGMNGPQTIDESPHWLGQPGI